MAGTSSSPESRILAAEKRIDDAGAGPDDIIEVIDLVDGTAYADDAAQIAKALDMAAAETPGPVGISMGPWREQFHWMPTFAGMTCWMAIRQCQRRLVLRPYIRPSDESSLHI